MPTWSLPRTIAHRGGALVAPENTLPAFMEAARRGFRAIECDVQLTADGVPVLLHDNGLKRTTGIDRQCIDCTAAELATLDAGRWFDPRFAGATVPTFDEAMACWMALEQVPFIEIKNDTPGVDAGALGRIIARRLLERWRGLPSVLISFSADALAAAAEVAPGVPRGLLLWDRDGRMPADWRARVERSRASCVDIHWPMATPAVIDELHAAGLGVVVWTLDDPVEAERLWRLGVDAITTDAIHRLRP